MKDWIRNIAESRPLQNQRVLVSDGETTAIARMVINPEHLIWIFDDQKMNDLSVVWWKELPTLPPVVKVAESI